MADEKRGYYPHAAWMKDLAAGDSAVFDPFYGIERIKKVSIYEAGWGELPDVLYAETVMVITVERSAPGFDPYDAVLFRRGGEPVTIWRLEHKLPSDIRERLSKLREEIEEISPPPTPAPSAA